MLSVLFCFVLLDSARAGLAAETVPGPGSLQSGAYSSGEVLGDSDMDVFRLNTADHPLESADALARLLQGKTKDDLDSFRQQHCGKIAELMVSLHRAVVGHRITTEEFLQAVTELSPFDLHPPTERGFQGWPPSGGKKRDAVEALVDVHIAADSGDKDKAGKILDATVQAYPQNPSVRTAAANYYNEEKDYSKAQENATAAIQLNDKDPDAYKARALAKASLQDRQGAIEDIKKAMSIDPQDESARVLGALLESRRSTASLKTISSVSEIRRALGDAEEDAALIGAGGQAAASGGGERAGEISAQADPDFARSKAYLKTALAKNHLGDYRGAAHYATLAIEKDPGNYEAYLERAHASNFLGRYDDAVRDAGYVIEKDPSNMQAYNMRAWALNRKGQAKDAVSDASRAIGINPGFADAWFNRALAYEKQGDYKRMLEDFKQAASLSGAYSGRYQDAVAQYGPRVPGCAAEAGAARMASAKDGGGTTPAGGGSPLRRFLTLMFFTLTGGGLVAAGLLHIMSSRSAAEEERAPRSTHPDVLSPSVFYEGVATGKYKIERKLGAGAMGVVYEATDQSLGRKVAIKKMSDEIKVNDREKQRFLEEARTVALLHHPGIVEIYTIFEEGEDIYLVFEHVGGETLDRLIEKEGRLLPDKALKVFAEAADALAYAHSKNVVHRDLKLSNIMLSAEGAAKVMYFGLAFRARESAARLSHSEVVGSPAYMAPEQDLGAASAQSDIYSLGVCLYEALSGVLPFQGPDFHHQKERMVFQKLSQAVPGLPQGIDDVIARCLAPDQEARFRSAEELRSALSLLM